MILLFAFIFLIAALCQPDLTLAGASGGLMIWFQKLLPTLLPFLIVVNLLQNADIFSSILNVFPKKKRLAAALITVIFGLLFGLPVGAKLAADFSRRGYFTPNTGNILLCACNQLSPAFVGTYVMLQCFSQPNLIGVSYLILYLPPILLIVCFLILRPNQFAQDTIFPEQQKQASRFQTVFQIIDASILNGFETITRLGGYLILFGILCQYLQALLPAADAVKGTAMMLMEITGGIHFFSQCPLPFPQKYTLGMAALSFGGLCTHAQTFSVIADAPLSKRAYLFAKLLFALLTMLLSALVIRILY